jgi:hypothetical protein
MVKRKLPSHMWLCILDVARACRHEHIIMTDVFPYSEEQLEILKGPSPESPDFVRSSQATP